jgi:GTP cyclohydrolase II
MITFKTFKQEYCLQEATVKSFQHIAGFDPEKPEHKDMITGFNAGHSANDPNIPRNASQVKTLDQLKTATEKYTDPIQKGREAFKAGHIKLIYHNPVTKVKVFKVKNQLGSSAVGGDGKCIGASTHCTTEANSKKDYAKEYGGGLIVHLGKEKGKYSKLGLYGKYEEGKDTSQDSENKEMSDEDWNRIANKHKLDDIPAIVKHRAIEKPMTDVEKKAHVDNFEFNIQNGFTSGDDIRHAVAHNYLTDKHINNIVKAPHSLGAHIDLAEAHRKGTIKMPDEAINTMVKHNNTIVAKDLVYGHSEGSSIPNEAINTISKNPRATEAHMKLANMHAWGSIRIPDEAINNIAANNPQTHNDLAAGHRIGRYKLPSVSLKILRNLGHSVS